jgi:Fe2+ or Zn2+ uptake regulation protein
MNLEADLLRRHGINPSAQRLAVLKYVLKASDHPSAEQVLARVRDKFPMISRGTIYNTLHLFVEKGLLRQFALTEGCVVFDPNVEAHHHFIDEMTGAIYDVPWECVRVDGVDSVKGFEVSDYQVVMRGRKRQPERTGGK